MKNILNTLKSEFKAVISGSQLTKNFDLHKEPFMHAGLQNLWLVYNATRRPRDDHACIFILEKKGWDKKKSEACVESGLPADNMKE